MNTAPSVPAPLHRLAPLALLCLALLWAYWAAFGELVHTWNSNPQYSHGFLVPLFAAYLLWMRRDKLDLNAMRPSLIGFILLGAALGVRLFGAYRFYASFDTLSLVPCVAGLVLAVGGWAAMRWAWPAVLFLGFMIPLPYFASVMMSSQLQTLATITSTFIMQTLGLPAIAEGNVILLNENVIGIVEACSGLRMLVVFLALSTAVVLVVDRHWIDRTIIFFSAIPIALICNIIRVTATGIMYDMGHSEFAKHFFHDVAGWVMMPMALGMMWVELKVLSALFVDEPASKEAAKPAAVPASQRKATVTKGTAQQRNKPIVPRSRRNAAPSQPTDRELTQVSSDQAENQQA
jgi:exosortase